MALGAAVRDGVPGERPDLIWTVMVQAAAAGRSKPNRAATNHAGPGGHGPANTVCVQNVALAWVGLAPMTNRRAEGSVSG